MTSERIDYDEFGLFHENAAEHGLPYDEPPTVRREEVEVEPGRSVSALLWGEGEPELVLIHGGAQNAHTWDTVALALRPRSLVAVDLPGHGHSDGPPLDQRPRQSPIAAAGDVASAIRQLAPRAAGIVGMSFGGLITIALTEVAPELLRRVVLVDVLPGLAPEQGQHIVNFVDGPPTFADLDAILARTIEFNPSRSEASLRRGILHNAVQLPDGTWAWRHALWRTTDGSGDRGARPEESPRARIADELLGALGRITVPLLLARGLRPDSVLRDHDEAELLRRLPSAEVVHFEEAGHSIQGDMPVELADTIARFVPATV